MKNKKIAALLGILLAGSMAFSLSACGNSNDSASDAKSDTSTSDTTDKSSDSSADDSNGAGFEEIQVDEKHSDQDVDALTVNAVYFQPIDMEPSGMGLKAADASFHLEADIHANEKGTELGYGKGDFVPDLTVNYEIINNANNETVGSGTFMQMNASDGPHYGANFKFPEGVGVYDVKFVVSAPGNDYLLHVDKETGVTGRFWTEPLVAEWPDFEWNGPQW